MLVGTPGFQQIRVKFMGNVGRHTKISADNNKVKWNVGRHTWFSAYNGKIHGKCW